MDIRTTLPHTDLLVHGGMWGATCKSLQRQLDLWLLWKTPHSGPYPRAVPGWAVLEGAVCILRRH